MENLNFLIEEYLTLSSQLLSSVSDEVEEVSEGFTFEEIPERWSSFGPKNNNYKSFIIPSDSNSLILDKIVRFKRESDGLYYPDFTFKKVSIKGRPYDVEAGLEAHFVPEVMRAIESAKQTIVN